MYRIALINMPFASVQHPSIALAQLRSCLERDTNYELQVDIFHLNHDFCSYFGHNNYVRISESIESTVSGLGDWMFQLAAYPDMNDDADTYIQRYPWIFQENQRLLTSHKNLRGGTGRFIDDLIDRYKLARYGLVGFTTMFQQNMACFAMARKLKQRKKGIVTAMGGANCETTMGSIILRNTDWIDFVFSGPALKTFPQVVYHLIDERREECNNIKGVFSKKKSDNNSLDCTDEIGDELNINIKVPLDYEDYFTSISNNCIDTETSILFETSRGCWWGQVSQCAFCGENPKTLKYRSMNPINALDQFDEILKYYPRTKRFLSVDKILPQDYLTEVLPYLAIPDDVSILYEVRADLKESEIQILADAGISRVQVGIESLSTKTLKLIRKGTTAFHNILFLKHCLTHGITPDWNLLIGFPGEQEDVYRNYAAILPQLFHLHPPAGTFPVRFDRYSPYFTSPGQYGLNLQPYDFYGIIYPFSNEVLGDFAYYFADQDYNKESYIAMGKWIDQLEEPVSRWKNLWHQNDSEIKPSLLCHNHGSKKMIYDTRSGSAVYHEIPPDDFLILEHFKKPMKRSQLAGKIKKISPRAIDNALELFCELGLVFRENDRFLSLIVDFEYEQGLI